jgi:hypothetical protein
MTTDFQELIPGFSGILEVIFGFVLLSAGTGFFLFSLDKRHRGFLSRFSKDGTLKISSLALITVGAFLIYQTLF